MNLRQRLLATATLLGTLASCNGYESPTAPTPPVTPTPMTYITSTILTNTALGAIETNIRHDAAHPIDTRYADSLRIGASSAYQEAINEVENAGHRLPSVNLSGAQINVDEECTRRTPRMGSWQYSGRDIIDIGCPELLLSISGFEDKVAHQFMHAIAHRIGRQGDCLYEQDHYDQYQVPTGIDMNCYTWDDPRRTWGENNPVNPGSCGTH